VYMSMAPSGVGIRKLQEIECAFKQLTLQIKGFTLVHTKMKIQQTITALPKPLEGKPARLVKK